MTTLALLLFVCAGRDAGVAPAPRKAPAQTEAWDFDDAPAAVSARGDTRDPLSSAALQQLGLKLEGPLRLKASAHPNTAGGVTLRLEDPADPSARCDLYAQRTDDGALRFDDSRCSFTAFSGRLRTTATCRRITGTATRRADGSVALDARSPDCTAAPLGVPLTLSGTLVHRTPEAP